MNDSDVFANYIRDIVYIIRERASSSMEKARTTSSEFDDGRVSAFREVLALMQSQADAFEISRSEVCLDGFDAWTGPVDPPIA